jgi:glutamine---fructose-6-phosphate transaminase (isomerizing)
LCGIAGFISNGEWCQKRDDSWLDKVLAGIGAVSSKPDKWEEIAEPLKDLLQSFDSMMSFGFHFAIVGRSSSLEKMEKLATILEASLNGLNGFMEEHGRTDGLERIAEQMRDCLWQIRQEVQANVERTLALMPEAWRSSDGGIKPHFAAWAIEQVMENLDRLEVRGRDSAGISIELLLPENAEKSSNLTHVEEFVERFHGEVKIHTWFKNPTSGRKVVTFVYRIANLVGRLGDNTAGLRSAVRNDEFLWQMCSLMERVSIVAHTRWASNGIISLGNCHPVDGTLFGPDHLETKLDAGAVFALNGDVDNYKDLVDKFVVGQGFQIEPTVTTDAKILPVFFRLGTEASGTVEDRFASVLNNCDGSLAIVMQHPCYPERLFLGQKGSGQSLFIGKIEDGFIFASEVYGLAARTRRSYALSGTEHGGTQVTIDTGAQGARLTGKYLDDGQPFEIKSEPIYIHSRDIFRGDYNYYFEKEIFEAPLSVRKTIKDKYRKVSGRIEFAKNGQETFSRLLSRLRDTDLPQIRRIMVIGQGTASIAAMGTAYLIKRALMQSRIVVDWSKSSEMSGFLSDLSLEDMLLIAISQSGTTTDTNRTVDVAGSQGAWIHSIVNRRNSPLVSKSNSHFYTSDGRDVEMAVASTKAFYSQIAAGKLVAMLLAQEFRTLSEEEIYQDVLEMEKLPQQIEEVLRDSETIRLCAEKYGPGSRNWAVVGNGPNKIAADEIRIKLSELCYKSIPCDFTEDKKHIDLSTEPLTIVVANDLPDQIVQDTAKEVAIFKAHNGKPIVLAARGEKRFTEYAESLIELPPIGAGLGFVLATVAGHLWGFYTAKAIDSKAEEFRVIRSNLTKMLERPESWNPESIQSKFWEAMKLVATGSLNSSLPASAVAGIAIYLSKMQFCGSDCPEVLETVGDGISILNKAIEEVTRPIDTIRHQAKTVTVGISRPQEILPPILLDAVEQLGLLPTQVKEQDRRLLRLVSPIIASVEGGLFYEMDQVAGDGPRIQAMKKTGFCRGKASRYDQPRPVGGSKRTALRLERAIWSSGPKGEENLLIVPLFDERTGECLGIALFHLGFQKQASVQQKLGILRGLGSRYHEIIEQLEEISSSDDLERVLAGVSPRDLILAPLDKIIGTNRR